MSVPQLAATRWSAPDPSRPTLLLGPSLGGTAAALWHRAVPHWEKDFTLVGWDLPGHGESPAAGADFSLAELATAVARLAEEHATGDVRYAGVSIGGAVGIQLGIDHPERFSALTIICSAAQIGTPEAWHERAALVREEGTAALEAGSRQRWFTRRFLAEHPEHAEAVLGSLRATDPGSYAFACEALAGFDQRAQLGRITAPLLAVAGEHDPVCSPADAEALARGAATGRAVVVPGVSHLAPLEAPEAVASLVRDHGRPAARR
ncbi:alpha/beta fold hydrolase [Zhihengliuella flava]|uniref:3-oxoadipate enol-lactonase n=1 Tax=Zhihengliuella flava TaxID=1285193 RepID=A0A931DB83_9MICC|nr:alpha/beta hydrolase [Zhihengliuella flava]MBG6084346.1 3-oxoadipate enol-lactonase [Zhihengliuella flava]